MRRADRHGFHLLRETFEKRFICIIVRVKWKKKKLRSNLLSIQSRQQRAEFEDSWN